ncbi:MAG: hypothetical protein PHD58_09610 [Anaerolineales bacterium]|nr:hypothetical protein [Anaerolineales bacterium]
MSTPVMILLVGFLFIVFFGGFSLLRREGLSMRFAIEALLVTFLVSGLTWALRLTLHPVIFLGVLYLLTLRVRLLVDAGNLYARRGRYDLAARFYQLAGNAGADQSSRMIVLLNRHTLTLQEGDLDGAIAGFKALLEEAGRGYLGLKYEAAAHYNLGVAYRRKGAAAQAIAEFNAAIDSLPSSLYAQRAEAALNQMHQPDTSSQNAAEGGEG